MPGGVYKKRNSEEDVGSSHGFDKGKLNVNDSGLELQNISKDSSLLSKADGNGIVNEGFDGSLQALPVKDKIVNHKNETESNSNDSDGSSDNRSSKSSDQENVVKGSYKKNDLAPLSINVKSLNQQNNSVIDGQESWNRDHQTISIDDQIHYSNEMRKSAPYARNSISRENNVIQRCFGTLKKPFKSLWNVIRPYFPLIILITYIVYLGFAISHDWEKCEDYCTGSKFLTILSGLVFIGLIYFFIIKRYFRRTIRKMCLPFSKPLRKLSDWRYFSWFMYVLLFACMLGFVIYDSADNRERLISFAGLWILLILGYIFSKHPSKVIFRHVAWGVGLQFVFALLILRWDIGRSIFLCLGNKVSLFLSYTDQGSSFVYGYLVTGIMQNGIITISNATSNTSTSVNNLGDINGYVNLPQQAGLFFFKVLPVIFFFSFFVSVLYYMGTLQWVVMKVGWLLQITVGTTAAESMNASANIFLGQTEAPLLIKPFLSSMTNSELHAVMTGGFATIAGTVLAAYISFGVSASHLLSASVMSAPAALAYSKLFYPETEQSKTNASDIRIEKASEQNALEAAAKGVSNATFLVAGIVANLIAFLSFIYFIDQIIIFFGALVGWEISMTFLMSKIFMPLAFIMGVQWDECDEVGELIGLKTILNEFIAYSKLGEIKGTISARSEIIATYALCGFSNLASIGMQLGGLGAMAPDKIGNLAEVALRAFIAGTAACFMTACIAGCLLTE